MAAFATEPAPVVQYAVKAGDTLWGIAADKYGSPFRWSEIAAANHITDPTKLRIGLILTLTPGPGTKPAPAQPTTTPSAPGAPNSTVPAADTTLSAAVGSAVAWARAHLDDSYVYAAEGPRSWDCSSFVKKALETAGVKGVPRTTYAQANLGTSVSPANIKAGDIVLYYPGASHVGLYIGGGKIIHASNPRTDVAEASLRSMPIHSVRRPSYPGGAALTTTPATTTGGAAAVPEATATVVSANASVAELKAMARATVSAAEWPFMEKLVQRESGWNPRATNPSSGAYGLPQSLPGSKMASAGSDWRTNPVTQIAWMRQYVKQRYGSFSNAWSHSQTHGWY